MKHVTNIQVGATPEAQVVLVFTHDDGTNYATKLDRPVCAQLISVLEQAHGIAMGMSQHKQGWQDGVRIQDDAQMRIE